MTIPDLKQRARALDPSTSFICEAPAGSGKTELLTQRFLKLLATVKKPEEILAITFTRKAAGEMRDRILSALARGMNDIPPESDHEKMTWQLSRKALQQNHEHHWFLLDTPNRLQIKTFDSLCSGLANSLPNHSSFSAPPKIIEKPEEIYQHAAQAFLLTLEEDRPWSESLATLFRLLDNNMSKIEKLLQGMLARREAWLPLVVEAKQKSNAIDLLEGFLCDVRREEIVKLRALIPPNFHAKLIHLLSYAASQSRQEKMGLAVECCLNLDVKGNELPGCHDDEIKQWLAIVDTLLTSDGNWRKRLNKNNGFPAGGIDAQEKRVRKTKKEEVLSLIDALRDVKGLENALHSLRFLPAENYATEQRGLLKALFDVLPVLSAYLNLSFQELGEVDFSEVSIRARQALGQLENPSELALALDYKIQHILVDEFQDTSPAQVELLERLTEGWQRGDGRTLFCVGDAMQSIYGFREANVGLFLRCIENGLGAVPLEPIKLESNFRSDESVVTWVNGVFSRAFPEKNDVGGGAVAYSNSHATREGGKQNAVELHGFAGASARAAEAQKVLHIIQEKRNLEPEGRIAILVRNRKHADHITPLLKAARLRYRAVDLEALSTHAIIQDLMSLTHALLYREDRIAWLAILRAPWAGLTLSDLNIICNIESEDGRPLTLLEQLSIAIDVSQKSGVISVAQSEQVDLFEQPRADADIALSHDGLKRVSRLEPILQQAVNQSHRKNLRHWVEGTWIALGGPACLYNQQQVKNADLFFTLLESDSFDALTRRDALRAAVDKLYAAPDPQADDKLQIMTIHKAKGLEFDTVIVPSLDSPSKGTQQELLAWAERVDDAGETRLLMAPITASGQDKDPTRVFLQELQKQRERNERCRLFYVACTRARQSLYLMATVKAQDNEQEPIGSPAAGSILATAWDALKLKMQLHRTDESSSAGGEIDASDTSTEVMSSRPKAIARLKNDLKIKPISEGNLLSDFIPYFAHDNTQRVDMVWRDTLPSLIGTAVHRILQDLNLETINRWTESGTDNHDDQWRSLLMSLGVAPRHLSEALNQTNMIINKVVADREHHWLFDQDLPFRRNEYALTVSTEDTFSGPEGARDIVIDLLLTNHKGESWLIDFKTSIPAPGETEESFVARMLARHREAMMRYRKAVLALGFDQLTSALYLPALGRIAVYP